MSLHDISWAVQETALAGSDLVSSKYIATATYRGSYSKQVATGYMATARYSGMVTKSGLESITYALTYVGEAIAVPEPEVVEVARPNFIPAVAIAAAILLALVVLICLIRRRNVSVFIESGDEYSLTGKLRITAKNPIINLERAGINAGALAEGESVAVLIKKRAAAKLQGRTIVTACGEFYTPADGGNDWVPSFAEPGQLSDEPPATQDITVTFDTDYVAPSSGDAVYPDVWAADTTATFNSFTLPDAVAKADGSLGTLTVSRISLKAAVYEGENLETMNKGVGHFSSTSAWEGNIGLCSHNRTGFFGRLKELKVGDVISYKTTLGTRTYQVTYVGQISETDFSYLSRSESNMLTMITCVENVPSKRLVVRAVETL